MPVEAVGMQHAAAPPDLGQVVGKGRSQVRAQFDIITNFLMIMAVLLAIVGALGLTGTPSYVVGNQIFSGAIGYEALKEAVGKARGDVITDPA